MEDQCHSLYNVFVDEARREPSLHFNDYPVALDGRWTRVGRVPSPMLEDDTTATLWISQRWKSCSLVWTSKEEFATSYGIVIMGGVL